MTTPDRAEFRVEPTLISESPRRNGYIPRWLRVSTFAFRTSLALLTTAPGTVVAADAINHIDHSSIVYDSGRSITVNPPHDFDQPLSTMAAQSSTVYKLHLNTQTYVIRGFRDEPNFRGDFPIDRSRTVDAGISARNVHPIDSSRMIDNWGNTHILLGAGQPLEISATGRAHLKGPQQYERYTTGCNDSIVFDPDGRSYWRNTVCPPRIDPSTGHDQTPLGMLQGNIGSGWKFNPRILIGSYWKGIANRDGILTLWINFATLAGTSGGFDVTVTVHSPPLVPTPTIASPPRPASPPEPIRTTIPTEKGFDLPGWLLGAGAAFLTALAADRFYRRWKVGKGTTTVPTTGTAGGTSPSATTIPRIREVAGVIGAGPNQNVAPNFGPAQRKNPEWIVGQQDFERRWQAAKSRLSPKQPGDTGNEPGYVLERFKTAMSIIQEVSLDSTLKAPRMAVRVRAGIEYLIPEIWPDNRIFRRFFDPNFNAGYLTEEDLAKIIYLPEQYRTLSKFNTTQRKDVTRIHRILIHALHPDTSKSDADPNLKDAIDDLLKGFNPAWSYIENLIK